MQRTLGRKIIPCALLLGAAQAGFAELPAAVKFDPIPVYSIYRPLKSGGSADDAFISGRVVEDHYAMAQRAGKPWRIAFLFPHMKDSYWAGASYGVISEARRLGVAVDILPSDGYNDLIGQLRRMDEAIAAKYDAIVISPISQTGNNSSIAKARARGIPVFELANDSNSDDLSLKVTTSLKGMGISAMEWVISDAQSRGLAAINIALLPGPKDAGWVRGCVEGTRLAAKQAAVHIIDIQYGDSDLVGQTQLAARLLFKHGNNIDYILGCTGCAPAAILPLKEARLSGKIRIVSYDLTREIANLIRKGEIYAAADSKGVSQARLTLNAAVNFLEGRNRALPHTILVKLGMLDQHNYAAYDFDASIAPSGYTPVLSYAPGRK
jgi:periplasmic protein TorT